MTPITLPPGVASLSQLEALYRTEAPAVLDPSCKGGVEAAAGLIARAAAGDTPVYGVNTGFGKLASHKIAPDDTETLQRNLILSHCCGVGEPLPRDLTRLMMALKLLSFGRGASGVRWEIVDLLQEMLARGVTPVVPAQGSVGASGDLAPLAHMTAVMIGEGEAELGGKVMPGREALAQAGLSPVTLGPKEGLACINGTQFTTACALAGLFRGWRAMQNALVISALSTDAIMGSTAPLQPGIHDLRGHRGQIEAASAMRAILSGSEIRESHRDGDTRVQDPYCIRCQPQVTGAAMDVLRQAASTLLIEANAATDNPLVLTETGAIVSGGNFHAEPAGFAADMIALALAEIGAIAQRRIALMVDPALSFDLPPFLTARSGPELRADDRRGDLRRAHEREQAPRQPLCDRLDTHFRQPGRPCLHGGPRRAAARADGGEPRAHSGDRASLRRRRRRVPGPPDDQPAAPGCPRAAPPGHSALEADRYLAPDLERAASLVATGALLDGLGLPPLDGAA